MKKTRKSPVIDLTPLVDLGFLLLTTFMLINFYSKPRLMELNMPDDEGYHGCYYGEPISRTLFLDKDSVYGQCGMFLHPRDTMQHIAYADLRAYILKQETEMESGKKQGLYGPRESVVYFIKPLSASRYENLVDVLDEMTICDVGTYAIVDVSPHEKTMLAQR
jgi:Biopolymer transport protein ExbD/TolR